MTPTMKLIGVSGTNGSGKDTVGQMLAQRHGWLFISVADMLRAEAKRRGLPIERENLRMIGGEWRSKYGLGMLVDKAVEEFNKAGGKYAGLVAIPMRTEGEGQRIKELGGTLVWVDAPPKLRYERITRRQRSTEDQKTYEQFLAEEEAEMHQTADPAKPNMSAVKKMSDIFIQNNTNDIETFNDLVEKALVKQLDQLQP